MSYARLALSLAAFAWLVPGLGATEVMATVVQQTQHPVAGQVRHSSGLLGGVLVTVKGTTVRTLTNQSGRYQIAATSPQDTLVFSLLGWEQAELAIGGRAMVDVVLQPSAIALQQLTVIGYQTVARDRMTAAVSVVDVDQILNTPTSNPLQALQGRVAGLQITQSGTPGANSTVRIRGISTLGNNNPLYVIDGIPTTGNAPQRLNPEDIESIQILRDAASASIYGSRASNGVIVITTKSPESQTFSMTYNSDFTRSTYANRPEVLNTEERGRVLWQAAINDGRDPSTLPIYSYDWGMVDGNPVLNRVIIPEYIGDPAAGIRAADTDWYKESTQPGMIQDHRLSMRTSGDRGGALLSLGWHNNVGIVRGTEARQVNARFNSSFNFLDGRLTLGENLSITQGRVRPNAGGDENPLQAALRAQPILPIYTEDGTGWGGPLGAGFDDRNHPLVWIHLNRFNRNTNFQAFGNVFANYRILPNLLATARYGVDWQDSQSVSINPTYRAGFMSRDINSMSSSVNRGFEWTFNSTLNYSAEMGRHNASVLAGFEALNSDSRNRSLSREGFAMEDRSFWVESAGTGPSTVSGTWGGYSLLSTFGNILYDYDDRYLASFVIRRDGSSRFGSENRYGVFPSYSLAWRLSNESFFPTGLFTELKLRYGYGKTGNQAIANNAQFSLFAPNYGQTAYDIHGVDQGNLASGFVRTQTGNSRLRWEETAESNFGLDFGLLENRLTGSLDYFDRTTSDILIQPSVLAVIGAGGQFTFNGASMQTKGGEFTLGYQDNVGDVRLGITGNVGHYADKIISLPDEVVGSYPGNVEKNILGRSVNSLFGYVADGIFQNQEEVDAHAAQPGKAIGRIRYKDLNGDGVINALDQDYDGTTNPKLEFGMNTSLGYGNFDLSFFMQGVAGRKVNNGNKTNEEFPGFWAGANWNKRVLNAWSPQNPNATIPAVTLADTNQENRASTYFREDGDYLKIRELVLGYRLPAIAGMASLEGSRLYLRVGNLWTKALGTTTLLDPEFTQNQYPMPRNITFGINATF